MTPRDASSKRILLMEDNPSDVFLLRRALEQHHVEYSLELVRDGEQALAMLNNIASGTEPQPDLIVLDLNLPRHDGIEVLAHCRSFPQLEAVAVMILTSSDSPGEKARAEELSVADFVRKPILLDDFMALGGRIKGILDGRSAST
jgi:two-component system, chemotaxis family, response regulator Rcp1